MTLSRFPHMPKLPLCLRILPITVAILCTSPFTAIADPFVAFPPLVDPRQSALRPLAEQLAREFIAIASNGPTRQEVVSLVDRAGLADTLFRCGDSLPCLVEPIMEMQSLSGALITRVVKRAAGFEAHFLWLDFKDVRVPGAEIVRATSPSDLTLRSKSAIRALVYKVSGLQALTLLPAPAKGGTFPPSTLVPAGTTVRGFFLRHGDPTRLQRTFGLSAFRATLTEITRAQYEACVAAGACTPAHYSDGACGKIVGRGSWHPGFVTDPGPSSNVPVQCVDWIQSRDYCAWVGGRLPTQMQWEYMARGGSTSDYFWNPPEEACRKANVRDASFLKNRHPDMESLYDCDDGYPDVAPAGRFPPNGFGLFDIDGNLREWVRDASNPFFFKTADSLDPVNEPNDGSGTWKNFVGMSFQSVNPVDIRYDTRSVAPLGVPSSAVGFRCVAVP